MKNYSNIKPLIFLFLIFIGHILLYNSNIIPWFFIQADFKRSYIYIIIGYILLLLFKILGLTFIFGCGSIITEQNKRTT